METHRPYPAPVVVDASSAILLYKSRLLEQWEKDYAITFTPAVFRELTRPGYPGAQDFARMADRVSPLPPPRDGEPRLEQLGAGERESILYVYRREKQGFLVVDDGAAARFCRNRGIRFINALLVPRIFYYNGRLSRDEFRDAEGVVISHGRYSPEILRRARAMDRTHLAYFLKEKI